MDDLEFSCSSKAPSLPMLALQTGVLMLKMLMLFLLHLLPAPCASTLLGCSERPAEFHL